MCINIKNWKTKVVYICIDFFFILADKTLLTKSRLPSNTRKIPKLILSVFKNIHPFEKYLTPFMINLKSYDKINSTILYPFKSISNSQTRFSFFSIHNFINRQFFKYLLWIMLVPKQWLLSVWYMRGLIFHQQWFRPSAIKNEKKVNTL